MKNRQHLKKALSFILTLAMLLGLLPTAAFATGESNAPEVLDYKGMSMIDLTGGQWVSRFAFRDSENSFYPYPVALAAGRSLTRLAYTIEKGQQVSLELYRFNGDYDSLTHHKEDEKVWDTYPMPYSRELVDSENDPYTTTQEDFLLGEPIGYLSGVVIRDNIKPSGNDPDTDPEAYPQEITPDQWQSIVAKA